MTSPMSPFQLPRDWRVYTDQILERCASLIQYGIWGDFKSSQLRRWMNNFTTDEERYFAACVLDTLIYRSKDQTLALIRQLFQRSLPDLTRLDHTPLGQIEDWQYLLQSEPSIRDPGVRLVAVGKKQTLRVRARR
jgi:predicted alpha/beta-fold hydrolase